MAIGGPHEPLRTFGLITQRRRRGSFHRTGGGEKAQESDTVDDRKGRTNA